MHARDLSCYYLFLLFTYQSCATFPSFIHLQKYRTKIIHLINKIPQHFVQDKNFDSTLAIDKFFLFFFAAETKILTKTVAWYSTNPKATT